MNQKLKEYIQSIPKAELHLHIEGSFEPELMFEIAQRNNIKLKYESVEELRTAYQFNNLQEFLDIYYAGATVLLYEQDFFDLTMTYLRRAAADNVIHTEIFFDPQTHTSRGVSFEIVINGIDRALKAGKERYGVSSLLILCFLRHLSEASAIETLQQALPHRDKFIGVGLDSSERGNPPEKFKEVFRMAREAGLHVVAHAGEEGSAGNVKETIELLKVQRIDHGVRAMDNPQLMTELYEKQIPLTVCPLSNVKLKVFEDLKDLPVKTFLEKGIVVTLNSDDPAYFGGYINDNYLQTAEKLNLSYSDIYTLAKNSFQASFISEKERDFFISKLNQFLPTDSTQAGMTI